MLLSSLLRRGAGHLLGGSWSLAQNSPATTALPATSFLVNRFLRTKTPGYREERVCANSDGSVIVCWHPEPKFPYEMTRPVPRMRGQVQTDSK